MKRTLAVLAFLLLAVGFCMAGAGAEKTTAEPERPVWLWGNPTWMGDFDDATLAPSNEWLKKNFGFTFKSQGSVPQGSTPSQALQLVIAQGQLPDIMIGFGLNDEGKKLLTDLVGQSKVLDLTKYFNDPKNYPTLAKADKAYLRSYMYNAKIYGFPGFAYPLGGDLPPYGGPYFYERYDVKQKYGAPSTLGEMYAILKKVQADKVKDSEGNIAIPLGFAPDTNFGYINGFLNQTNNGGWEVDAQKRLLPRWATKWFYDGLLSFNQIWREGLINPGAFIIDVNKYQEDLKISRYTFVFGPSWSASVQHTVTDTIQKKGLTPDSPEVKASANLRYPQIDYPNKDAPGLIMSDPVGFQLISAKCPNPDGVIKFLEFCLTDDGVITNYSGGYKDVDWEYTGNDYYWQLKGTGKANDQDYSKTTGGGIVDSKVAKEKKTKTPPAFYVTHPAYCDYYRRIWYYPAKEKEQIEKMWGYAYWSEFYWVSEKRLTQKVPSYTQVIADVPPQEASAMATATQRYTEGLAKVLTAANQSEFDQAYKTFVQSMISVTNWKPIYEARQKRWTDWMTANKVDDRADLKAAVAIAEWKAVMGW